MRLIDADELLNRLKNAEIVAQTVEDGPCIGLGQAKAIVAGMESVYSGDLRSVLPTRRKKMSRLIDADALENKLEYEESFDIVTKHQCGFTLGSIFDAIEALPTIDPESLRHETMWENIFEHSDNGYPAVSAECRNCGKEVDMPYESPFLYCPYCGDKVKEEE